MREWRPEVPRLRSARAGTKPFNPATEQGLAGAGEPAAGHIKQGQHASLPFQRPRSWVQGSLLVPSVSHPVLHLVWDPADKVPLQGAVCLKMAGTPLQEASGRERAHAVGVYLALTLDVLDDIRALEQYTSHHCIAAEVQTSAWLAWDKEAGIIHVWLGNEWLVLLEDGQSGTQGSDRDGRRWPARLWGDLKDRPGAGYGLCTQRSLLIVNLLGLFGKKNPKNVIIPS